MRFATGNQAEATKAYRTDEREPRRPRQIR
jgi:hypothetical protein